MRRVLDILEKVICAFLVVLLAAMLVVGSMQIIWRYLLKASLSWSEELLRYMYVWATMLGISLGIRRKGLAAIEIVSDFVGKHSAVGEKILHTIAFVIQAIVFVVLTYFGIKMIGIAGTQKASALHWPMKYIYLAFPIGGVCSVIYTIEEIINYYFKPKKEGGEV